MVSSVLHRLGHGVAVAWHAIIGWAWTPLVILVAIVIGATAWLLQEHRRWKKGWLSGLIDQRLSAIRKQRAAAPKDRMKPRGRQLLAAEVRLTILEHWDRLLEYLKKSLAQSSRSPTFRLGCPLSFCSSSLAHFLLSHGRRSSALFHTGDGETGGRCSQAIWLATT